MVAVPAVAQNSSADQQPSLNRQNGSQAPRQGSVGSGRADPGVVDSAGRQMQGRDRGQSDRAATNRSERQDFSRIRVGEASQLVGKMLATQNGRPAGDVEYLLIEPISGKVMYYLVGLGNWYTWDQQLAAVPFNAVSIRQVDDDDDDADSIDLTLVGGDEALRNAPRLSSNDLSNLTTPRVQYLIQNYWAPLMPASTENGRARGNAAAGNGARDTQSTSGAEGGDSPNRASGENDSADRRDGRAADRAPKAAPQQQAATSGEVTNGQDRSGQRQSSTEKADGADRDRNQSAGQKTYTLVGRSYITALAPPTVMRPDQIRGATVNNRDGEEVGSLERLVIDMDRGYVAYAIISEGGFLGMGEEYRPIPLQALQWERGESFMLPRSADQLRQMPKLREFEMPSTVRRTDVERLYASYDVTPYWEQRQTRSGEQGNQVSGASSDTSSNAENNMSTGSIGPQQPGRTSDQRSQSSK
ncbi:MAG: PRC-barrel domain-containing protein [Hyphomicrobiaceae bacterium]